MSLNGKILHSFSSVLDLRQGTWILIIKYQRYYIAECKCDSNLTQNFYYSLSMNRHNCFIVGSLLKVLPLHVCTYFSHSLKSRIFRTCLQLMDKSSNSDHSRSNLNIIHMFTLPTMSIYIYIYSGAITTWFRILF
jgi:hypothetical protein